MPDHLNDLINSDLVNTDEAFDCFTELVVHLLGVPVSLVTIIDRENDRQCFKAQTGLPEPWASQMETPLSYSVCQYVAQNDQALSIEDARLNDLVKDNLAISRFGVTAYLGTPIRNKDGDAIGAFCVISGEPRQWTDNEKETMSHISKCVSELLMAKEELVGLN